MGEKRLHVPMVGRTPDDPPPVIVAVVGPPGVVDQAVLAVGINVSRLGRQH